MLVRKNLKERHNQHVQMHMLMEMRLCHLNEILYTTVHRQKSSIWLTLPEARRVFCVQVVVLFLKAGVPLNKLEESRDVLEQNAYRLADKCGTYDLITFVFEKEQNTINTEILGTNVSAIFDGNSRIGEALAVIIRFVIN